MGKTSDRTYMLFALRMAGEFGATIAVPAVLGAVIGRTLDARWGTRPWALVLCLLITFAATALVLIRKAKAYASEFQNLINRNDRPSDRS